MRRIGSTPAQRGSTNGATCPDVIELRRVGSTPQERGSHTNETCPDVIDAGGDGFLIIGSLVGEGVRLTDDEQARMAELGASIGVGERAVLVPRDCLLTAARQLAAEDAAAEREAQGAYQAYGVVVDFLNFRGDPMPEWGDLPVKIKAAWVNAAMGVRYRALRDATAKLKAWAEMQRDAFEPGLSGSEYAAVLDAIALIDPRNPRSLDGDH
jgi:hypothetical protein